MICTKDKLLRNQIMSPLLQCLNNSMKFFIIQKYFLLASFKFSIKTKEEHLEHIRQVLQRLKEEKLLINLKNYSFMQGEIMYLGFMISVDGLKMDPEKVKVILD